MRVKFYFFILLFIPHLLFSFQCADDKKLTLLGYCDEQSFYGPVFFGNLLSSDVQKNSYTILQLSLWKNSVKNDFYGFGMIGSFNYTGFRNKDLIKVAEHFSNTKHKDRILKKKLDLGTFYGFFQIGGVQFNGNVFSLLQLGGVNVNYKLNALLSLGFANVSHKNIAIFQVGGGNVSATSFSLFQLAAYLNYSYEFSGFLQLGVQNHVSRFKGAFQFGILNSADIFFGAIQLGILMNETSVFKGIAQVGIYNYSKVGKSVQLGIINISKKVVGMQIGVYNQTDTLTGIQIGLLNFVKNGQLPFFPIINIGW